ncbi:DUF4232 domain-containing protein [Streptomyces piniterrae]|uniref:DUF4232 domain-containing protein n=1 Tax=Streptomyces piniterrae TaxID=2571125 RepID=A0A4U0NJC8_9ACTN|nr:DUF4232 domain-containing protein [Streptomyces piniterrae]TJZ54386.1 DUF4232 domain-containing protein [Streptomyces piniterrae]
MKSFRSRGRTRSRTAIATAALVAGLSLTACQNDARPSASDPAGDQTSAGTPAPTASGSASSAATGGSSGSTSSSGGGSQSTDGGNGGSNGGGGGSSASGACTDANTKVVVSKVTRPINHLLLTVTNTGSGKCDAYGAPALRFDDEQSATQLVEDSRPQAVVSLAPGESAYAAISLTGEPGGETHGRTAQKLGVLFTPRSGSGSVGSPVVLRLPEGTFKDDNAAVTYWQSDMQDALGF